MIYFDNASTTRPLDEVVSGVNDLLNNCYANPSSLHNKGFEAERIIENARNKVASALGVGNDELFFTSGGTESNNTAILGVVEPYKRRGKHFITTVKEHPSVAACFDRLEEQGCEVTRLEIDNNGFIDLEVLRDAVRDDTVLVSIMHINNEFGAIEPIEKIADIIKEKNPEALFHVDNVQGFLKHSFNPKKVDLISISAHKIHALKGTGALYIKKGIRLESLHFGGGQEKTIRPGTENLVGIYAMGEACEIIKADIEKNYKNALEIKNELLKITEILDEVIVNGDVNSSPYILNLTFKDIKGEVLLHSLDSEGIMVATGSACTSKVKNNRNKKIVDFIENGRGEGAVRFSIGHFNTVDEAKEVVKVLEKNVPMLRRFKQR